MTPTVTVKREGGQYCPDRDPAAPIRIYSDRRVEDDIAARASGRRVRERLSVKEYRRVRLEAKQNRLEGLV